MDLKLAIGIEQLLELIRQLPIKQRARVKELLDTPKAPSGDTSSLERLLLDGPTWGDVEIAKVEAARDAFKKWRSTCSWWIPRS